MRYLTQIEDRQKAEAFVAYMITQSVATHIEAVPNDASRWEVWIRNEDDLAKARTELAEFQANPLDPKYAGAIDQAREIIKQKQEASEASLRNIRKVKYRSASNNPLQQGGPLPPLTLTLLIVCILVSLFSNFSKPRPGFRFETMVAEKLNFVSVRAYVTSGRDPAANIKQGEVWRMITPAFLHGSVIHLVMNMMGLVALGRLTERLFGTVRFAMMMLPLCVIPITVACLIPPTPEGAVIDIGGSPFTVGLSGALYGLSAFLWLLGMQRPELGFRIPNGFIIFLWAFILLGFVGVIPGISNWGHLIGFLVGLLLALMIIPKR